MKRNLKRFEIPLFYFLSIEMRQLSIFFKWQLFIFFVMPSSLFCGYPCLFDPPFGSYFDESDCLLLVWGACSCGQDTTATALSILHLICSGITYQLVRGYFKLMEKMSVSNPSTYWDQTNTTLALTESVLLSVLNIIVCSFESCKTV